MYYIASIRGIRPAAGKEAQKGLTFCPCGLEDTQIIVEKKPFRCYICLKMNDIMQMSEVWNGKAD